MIVDVHTHTPTHRTPVPPEQRRTNHGWRPDRAVEAAFSWGDHQRVVEPVDRAIVFPIAPPPGKSAFEMTSLPWPDDVNLNDLTAAYVKSDPKKLIGFATVHPDTPGACDEIDRCIEEHGFRGLKLAPNYQNFEPLSPAARVLYAHAERRGLPILFHQGTSPVRLAPIRYAHPLVMDEVAIAFPELRIVMAHMGHPWQADCITVIRKHPHVYADISGLFYRPWSFYQCMVLAMEWGVLPKLLFASDYPITTPAETMAALRSVNQIGRGIGPQLPEEQLEAIIHRDALALLGIEDRGGEPAGQLVTGANR